MVNFVLSDWEVLTDWVQGEDVTDNFVEREAGIWLEEIAKNLEHLALTACATGRT